MPKSVTPIKLAFFSLGDIPIPGLRLFLQALKTRGVRLVFIGESRKYVEQNNLTGFFNEVFNLSSEKETKAMKAKVDKKHEYRPDETAIFSNIVNCLSNPSYKTIRRISINYPPTALKEANPDLNIHDFTNIHALLKILGLDVNPRLPFDEITTYSATGRTNLVTIDGLLKPGVSPVPEWNADGFEELVDRIIEARRNGRPVVFSMGAHVIKNNLSLYLIALMKAGIITHLAGNGACSIHDFELAYLGGTSEHVPTAIEDGSFGMWEETGRWMNEAISKGVAQGYGYGESLARYIDKRPKMFPHRDACVLYQAWKCAVPATYHIALGTDIIHQHPICSFTDIGTASGRDFHTYCNAISQLDGGVFLNFGSGVIGPEVFLKALSISRNLGYPTFKITTGNFDLINLGDYRCKIGYDDPNYYYRPRKNIVNRPVSCGGKGWHFVGDHQQTIPNLYRLLVEKGAIQA